MKADQGQFGGKTENGQLESSSAPDATGVVVVVCGGREYADARRVSGVLDGVHAAKVIRKIVTGGCRGADFLAEMWAHDRRVMNLRYSADWKQHGTAAGPIRNQRMLDEERPDVVVAFPGGRGTADMVARAKAANVEVVEVAPEGAFLDESLRLAGDGIRKHVYDEDAL